MGPRHATYGTGHDCKIRTKRLDILPAGPNGRAQGHRLRAGTPARLEGGPKKPGLKRMNRLTNVVAIQPRNRNYNLSFGVFLSLPGQTWP